MPAWPISTRRVRRAEEGGRAADIVSSRNYLAEWRWATEGPAAGLAEWEVALELAEHRNVHSLATYTKGAALWALLEAGEWDRLLALSDDLLALPPGRLDPAVWVTAMVTRAHVLLARGQRSDVVDPTQLVDAAERVQELGAMAPAFIAATAIALADGEVEVAVQRLEAFESVTEGVRAGVPRGRDGTGSEVFARGWPGGYRRAPRRVERSARAAGPGAA